MSNLATIHELMMKSGGAMVLEKDIDVPMRDGVQLKANLYRPTRSGPYPVLLRLGLAGDQNQGLGSVLAAYLFFG